MYLPSSFCQSFGDSVEAPEMIRVDKNMRKQPDLGKLTMRELEALRDQIDTVLAVRRRDVEAQLPTLTTDGNARQAIGRGTKH
jgi:hypothetical protein